MGIFDAIGGVIGSIFDNDATKDANETNEKINARNIALQKEFAQKGVQWKVADSKAAGIHPLYGLGASTHSFTPSSIGAIPETGAGDALRSVGQEIDSSIDRTRTAEQRLSTSAKLAQSLELERGSLQNELLRTQIAELKARTTNPPFPAATDPYVVPSQADSGVKNVPLERVTTYPGLPHMEAGPVSDLGFLRTDNGSLAPAYSTDAKERLEDDWGGMLAWNLRNRILPSLGWNTTLPKPPPGKAWQYNPLRQEYYLVELGN